jgi:hypothetical protein
VLWKRKDQEVVPAELPHGLEINVEPAAGPTFNPLNSIHYFPAVISQFLAARSVLAAALDIHVGTARLPSRPAVGDQAL